MTIRRYIFAEVSAHLTIMFGFVGFFRSYVTNKLLSVARL